jgi:hypothetical protein
MPETTTEIPSVTIGAEGHGIEDITALKQGEFLQVMRMCLDDIDKIVAIDKQLKAFKAELQRETIRRCAAEDIQKMTGHGVTVTVKDQPVAKLAEGTDWNVVLAQLCEDGYAHMVQRRLSAAKLQEEVDEGYRLPDGVSIEEIKVATYRRS